MRWRSLFTTSGKLQAVEDQLVEMLRLDQRSYVFAHQALHGGDVEQLRTQVSDTDHQVNLAVQHVRRQLVVHASVSQSLADIPAMFTYMSIVKDIERIGDYARNILEIARARSDRAGLDDLADLAVHGDGIGELLSQVITVFEDHDPDGARQLLDDSNPTLFVLDALVRELTVTDGPGHVAVPRALYYRYLKRIASHLHNVLSSLVAPVDQLDFYQPGQ